MIEIPVTGKSGDRSTVKKRRGLSAVLRSGADFKTQLESAIGVSSEGDIDDLMDALREREKRFMEAQSLYEMNLYKNAVRQILKKILNESVHVKVVKRRLAEVEVVEIINQKLLDLSSSVTAGRPAYELMKTMEDIKGLLFDLFH
jgi:uncharacterized protein YaaR (DUF327 family)